MIVLNGIIKPTLDRFCFDELARAVGPHGDEVLEQTLRSMAEDGRWHVRWFCEAARVMLLHDRRGAAVFDATAPLRPRAIEAVSALTAACSPLLDDVDVRGPLLEALTVAWSIPGLGEEKRGAE